MNFKNDFERRCFDAVRDILGDVVELQHNRVLTAGFTPGTGVISFTGPPKKEIDILVVHLSPAITLLISAKNYQTPAAPLAVQEWAAVVHTMNDHAISHAYLGIVICSSGFTEGCPAWAIDHNIGLIPPYKGRSLNFGVDTAVEMLKRIIASLRNVVSSPHHRLKENGNFYWDVYKCLGDFPEPSRKNCGNSDGA